MLDWRRRRRRRRGRGRGRGGEGEGEGEIIDMLREEVGSLSSWMEPTILILRMLPLLISSAFAVMLLSWAVTCCHVLSWAVTCCHVLPPLLSCAVMGCHVLPHVMSRAVMCCLLSHVVGGGGL